MQRQTSEIRSTDQPRGVLAEVKTGSKVDMLMFDSVS